jgi:hypothetical protein
MVYNAVDHIKKEIETKNLVDEVMNGSLPTAVNIACQALVTACLDKQLSWLEVMQKCKRN